MLEKFKSLLKNEFDHFKDKKIFLAISGGKDSMTLSHLLLATNIKHTLLHCNFKLRENDSDEDESFILNYGKKNNLPVYTTSFDTKTYANKNKVSIQEAARSLRYSWFNSFISESNCRLLTAHHLDDSIETFFINLLRGTSIEGLSGIPMYNDKIIRPLIHFSQEEIIEYVKANQIIFRQDESNFEDKYLRNDIRHNIIPLLETKGEKFKVKLAQTMESIKSSSLFIEEKALEFFNEHFVKTSENSFCIDKSRLSNQAQILLEYILKPFNIQRSQLKSFNQFLKSKTGSSFYSHDFHFLLNRDIVEIHKIIKDTPFEPREISQLPFQVKDKNQVITLTKLNSNEGIIYTNNPLYLNLNSLKLPLIIRTWEKGDRIQPLGMKGSKLISDILIDKKISLADKKNIKILADQNTIVAVVGICISEKHKITSQIDSVVEILLNN